MKLLLRGGRPYGRATWSVVVWLLGLMMAAQVAAITWALVRHQPVAVQSAPAVPPGTVALPLPAGTKSEASAAVPAPIPAAEVTGAPRPSFLAAQPTATLDTDIKDPTVLFYLDGGLAARETGDMVATINKLRAARDLLPNHPRLLFELASSYDQMGQREKAAAVWDEIYKLGPSAGGYFQMAAMKFEQGGGKAPKEIQSPLMLGKVLSRKENDPSAKERVTLRIPVQAQDGAAILPPKVHLDVLFYKMNQKTGKIELHVSDSDSPYRWLSGVPQWLTKQVEFLDAFYWQPQLPELGTAGWEASPDWRYYGYVIKLYYDNQLQDVVAEPKELVRRASDPREPTLNNAVDSKLFPSNSLLPPIQ